MKRIWNAIRTFELWFDAHFGWFFTNGMKQEQKSYKMGRVIDLRSGRDRQDDNSNNQKIS